MKVIKQTKGVPHNYRCTFSLPQDLATNITLIAKRLRMSQSALLAMLLDEPIAALAKLSAIIPTKFDKPVSADTVRRLRGESVNQLRAAVSDALAMAEELDPGLPL